MSSPKRKKKSFKRKKTRINQKKSVNQEINLEHKDNSDRKTVLELKNSKLIEIKTKKTMISGINIAVSEGDVVLITGMNGIGKSTLFKALLGFIGNDEEKYAKIDDEKTFLFCGYAEKKNLNRQIINIMQSNFLGFPLRRAKTSLLEAVPDKFADKEEYLAKWLKKYNPLTDEDKKKNLLEKFIFQLSGGEEKYLSILEGLVRCEDSEVKLALIDEPTNNLDTRHMRQLSDLILRIRHYNPHLAFIMISHCRLWPYITKAYEIRQKHIGEIAYTPHTCLGEPDDDGYYQKEMKPKQM